MTDAQLKETLLGVLSDVAPELDLAEVKGDTDLRNDLDLDSMDFLNFVIGLSRKLGVEIPEADYRRLGTLDDCVRYLQEKGTA